MPYDVGDVIYTDFSRKRWRIEAVEKASTWDEDVFYALLPVDGRGEGTRTHAWRVRGLACVLDIKRAVAVQRRQEKRRALDRIRR